MSIVACDSQAKALSQAHNVFMMQKVGETKRQSLLYQPLPNANKTAEPLVSNPVCSINYPPIINQKAFRW